jgi:hypothetical protein
MLGEIISSNVLYVGLPAGTPGWVEALVAWKPPPGQPSGQVGAAD